MAPEAGRLDHLADFRTNRGFKLLPLFLRLDELILLRGRLQGFDPAQNAHRLLKALRVLLRKLLQASLDVLRRKAGQLRKARLCELDHC